MPLSVPQLPSDIVKPYLSGLYRFLASEDGPTAVEYALMLSLIVLVCMTAISSLGTNVNSKFLKLASSLK
jgi:pilus assembly protein Flp/PilA